MKRLIRSMLLLGFSLCVLSCDLSTAVMTKQTYESIQIGTSIEEVEELAGPPYDTSSGEDGKVYYRYLERIQTGPNQVCQETYLLTVTHGRVITKEKKGGTQRLTIQGSN